MGHLPHWAQQPRPRATPWRRRQPRRWVRPNDLGSAAMLFAAIPSLPRAELTRLTERMIDRMDEMDGNTDVELNGDEADGSLGEDDFHDHSANWLGYPGCPISDPGEDEHDREQEQAYE